MSEAIITGYYTGILRREPAPEEVTSWLNVFNGGLLTLDQIREQFVSSTEANSIVDPLIRLYQSAFNRQPDAGGLDGWAAELRAGKTIEQIAESFAGSQEFTNLYGADTAVNAAYVTALYANVLGRVPAGAEVDAWVNSGLSRGEVLRGFSDSPEATARFEPSVNALLDGLGAGTAVLDPTIPLGAPATGGESFDLTVNQDTLTGTSGADTFNAPVVNVNGTLTDTLQSVDSINGGAGVDTLTATINSAAVITPTLNAVENVTIRSTNVGATLSLIGSNGVEKVTVANSTGAMLVNDLGAVGAVAVANQNTNVSFDKSTAATLAISLSALGTISKTAPVEVDVDLGATTASKATTLNITADNVNAEILDTTGVNVATAATIAASGVNELKLTDGANIATLAITGAGSVDLSEVALVKVATLTAGDGGVTFSNGDSTATTFTATTGAGKDTLTVDGANITTISTGAGDDTVTTSTAPLVATATISLGDGNDTLTLHAASAAGATLSGGVGVDTLATALADYTTISGYSAENRAKITGFETLSLTGAPLADLTTVDLSAIAGLTSAQILGVAAGIGSAATISNVGANSAVIAKGDLVANTGALTVTLKDATGASDVLNLTLDQAITQNNDTTVDTFTSAITSITTNGVETLNITSTGTLNTDVTAGNETDIAVNGLTIVDNALVTLNILGDQGFTFSSAAGMTKLATVDVSANTAGGTVNVSAAATDGTAAAITVTGSAGKDTIVGSGNIDTISGGAGNDTITGGGKGDILSGGAGNDTFVYTTATDSTLVAQDRITDFSANTFGNGTGGAAGTGANTDTTLWTGDVLKFTAAVGGGITKVDVSVQANSADAQTFIQNISNATIDTMAAALDSSTSRLFVDLDSNGTIDSVIELTGVTTITEAAFLI